MVAVPVAFLVSSACQSEASIETVRVWMSVVAGYSSVSIRFLLMFSIISLRGRRAAVRSGALPNVVPRLAGPPGRSRRAGVEPEASAEPDDSDSLIGFLVHMSVDEAGEAEIRVSVKCELAVDEVVGDIGRRPFGEECQLGESVCELSERLPSSVKHQATDEDVV